MSRNGESVSEEVVRLVARAENRDGCELPLLYEAVDPDALDTLVERLSNGEVSFTYADYDVTIDNTGVVDLTPAAPSPSSTEAVASDD